MNWVDHWISLSETAIDPSLSVGPFINLDYVKSMVYMENWDIKNWNINKIFCFTYLNQAVDLLNISAQAFVLNTFQPTQDIG